MAEIEQEPTVQTEEKDRVAAKQAAAPIERRAATNFWIMLGRPVIEGMVTEWPKLMQEVIGYLKTDDIEEVKKFLNWTLEENPMSAEYLRLAGNPCRSLVKNMEKLHKHYLAWLKKQEIMSRKGRPAKKPAASEPKEIDDSDDDGLILGYTQEQIAAHAELCKENPWVQANDSVSARKRLGFVRHLMSLEPPKPVTRMVDGKPLPKYRQESGKNNILTGDI